VVVDVVFGAVVILGELAAFLEVGLVDTVSVGLVSGMSAGFSILSPSCGNFLKWRWVAAAAAPLFVTDEEEEEEEEEEVVVE